MKFIFLLLALGFLCLPLFFHLDKKIFNNGNLKAALGASLISTIIFSAIMVALQLLGILAFDMDNTLGLFFRAVPLEQYLLNFSFAFASIGVYQYFNIRFPNNGLQKYSLALSNLLLGLCVAFLFFGYPKWYTLLTFATLLVFIVLIEYVGTLRFMYRAYRTFLLLLPLFCLAYAFLFWNGLLVVAKNQVAGMYIAKVPVEHFFMALSMLLVSIYMFELFKSKKTN